MLTTGCLGLLTGMLCYYTTSGGDLRVTCSDTPMPRTFTCKEYHDQISARIEAGKRMGCMSQDGSTSSCLFTMPSPPR